VKDCAVVDLFCGAGGLTHGFILEGFKVTAGIDADLACKHAFEANNKGARFIPTKIEELRKDDVVNLFQGKKIKILVGCAPCQPFSSYNKKGKDKDGKWKLLKEFGDLISSVQPDIVSIENVPDLRNFKNGKVYNAFIARLKDHGYHVTEYPNVYCPDYGIPQKRSRLVVFASKFGAVSLIPPTHKPEQYRTVRDTISTLQPIRAGESSKSDHLHKSSNLSALNLKRIRASKPGGTWRDWDRKLVANCHLKKQGDGYISVYGRMTWDDPSPTITTQFYGFGSGRFGHPEQDRALSLREAALLQTFPIDYSFIPDNAPIHLKTIGRLIGNAVPVDLGRAISKSIKNHLREVKKNAPT
jgi:DNA (cytosine-5)-methyltransferase 1